MQWLPCVFVLALLFSFGSGQYDPDEEPHPVLLKLSESFLRTVPCGNRAVKDPLLNPFEPADVVFRVQLHPWIQAETSLKSMKIDGLQHYKVQKFDVKIFNLQADYEVVFEKITMQGIYNVSTQFTNLPDGRNGSINVKIHGLSIAGTVKFGMKGLRLELRSISVRPTVQSIESNIENVFSNILFNTVFNKMIETITPPMLVYLHYPISTTLEALLKPLINTQLKNLSLQDIIAGRKLPAIASCF